MCYLSGKFRLAALDEGLLVRGHVFFAHERPAAVDEELPGEVGGVDALLRGPLGYGLEEALELIEVASVYVKRVGDVDVLARFD